MYSLSYMDFKQRSQLSIVHYILCVSITKIIFIKHVSFPVAHVLYYNTYSVIMSTIILKFYIDYTSKITVPTHSHNIYKIKQR